MLCGKTLHVCMIGAHSVLLRCSQFELTSKIFTLYEKLGLIDKQSVKLEVPKISDPHVW